MWIVVAIAACRVPCHDGTAWVDGQCLPTETQAPEEPAYDFSQLDCDLVLEEAGGAQSSAAIDVPIGGSTTICGGLYAAGHANGHFTGDVDAMQITVDAPAQVTANLFSDPQSEVHAYFLDGRGEVGVMAGPEPVDPLTWRPDVGASTTIDVAGYQGEGGPFAIELETKALLVTNNVTAGWSRACTVVPPGDVECWGEWGDEVSQTGVDAVTAVTGAQGACALTSSGELRCWGQDDAIYDATGTYMNVAVLGYSQGHLVCAIDSGGAITCWDTLDVSSAGEDPGLVGGPWRQVSTGFHSTCAVDVDGRVACAGDYLADVPEGSFEMVEVAQGLACALTTGGSIVCWADNDAYASAQETAALVPEESGFEDLAIGFDFVCALRSGELVCWGTLAKSAATVRTPLTSIVGGNGHACGVRDDGALVCWGFDRKGVVSDTP